jgi:hypothetical protein
MNFEFRLTFGLFGLIVFSTLSVAISATLVVTLTFGPWARFCMAGLAYSNWS